MHRTSWKMLQVIHMSSVKNLQVRKLSGWWFGTFFIFPYIGNNRPNWLIFFRGVETTNQLYWDETKFCARKWNPRPRKRLRKRISGSRRWSSDRGRAAEAESTYHSSAEAETVVAEAARKTVRKPSRITVGLEENYIGVLPPLICCSHQKQSYKSTYW